MPSSLDRIGISVNVKRVSEAEFLEQLYLPKFKGGGAPSFDMLLLSVPAGTIFHAAMIPMTLLYSREPNESAVRDPKIDELYLAGIHTYDLDKGRQIWRQLEEYVATNHLLVLWLSGARGLRCQCPTKIYSTDSDDVLGRVL